MSEDNSQNGDESNQELPNRDAILRELEAIKAELALLNEHKLIRAYNSSLKMMFLNFLRGISIGLGSIFGATVVLSALVFLLSQIEFVPIIGEWVTEIIQQVNNH